MIFRVFLGELELLKRCEIDINITSEIKTKHPFLIRLEL